MMRRAPKYLWAALLFAWTAAILALQGGGAGFLIGLLSAHVLDWMGVISVAEHVRLPVNVPSAGAAVGAACGWAVAWRMQRDEWRRSPDDDLRRLDRRLAALADALRRLRARQSGGGGTR